MDVLGLSLSVWRVVADWEPWVEALRGAQIGCLMDYLLPLWANWAVPTHRGPSMAVIEDCPGFCGSCFIIHRCTPYQVTLSDRYRQEAIILHAYEIIIKSHFQFSFREYTTQSLHKKWPHLPVTPVIQWTTSQDILQIPCKAHNSPKVRSYVLRSSDASLSVENLKLCAMYQIMFHTAWVLDRAICWLKTRMRVVCDCDWTDW